MRHRSRPSNAEPQLVDAQPGATACYLACDLQACFAVGWGITGGQVIAHLEGGRSIAIPPTLTYLISEIGVVFIFGCGAILLGLALIVLARSGRAVLPGWLYWLTLICGVAGIAGLAFFTFFVLMLWGLAAGTGCSRPGGMRPPSTSELRGGLGETPSIPLPAAESPSVPS